MDLYDPSDLFRFETRNGEVRQGDLLVAEPFLDEAYFTRAVVALIDYDNAGGEATGVVLNNRAACSLADLLGQVSKDVDVPVYVGGPLGHDRLYFIHTLGADVISDARLFAPGIYIGGDFDSIVDYVNSGYTVDGAVRFFIGYSGWAKGQLDDELKNDVWAVSGMPQQPGVMLAGQGEELWRRAVGLLGNAYRPWLLVPRNVDSN